VELVDFGDALEIGDFSAPTGPTFGLLTQGADFSPWSEALLTEIVRNAHEGRASRFQFRLRYPDGIMQTSIFQGTFSPAGGLAPGAPQLVVELKLR
jgi:hypothetical protein